MFSETIENNFWSRCKALHVLEQKGPIDIKLGPEEGTIVRSANTDCVVKTIEMN